MNLRFAWAVLMLGMNQHDVAALFGVNGGRVAEAVQAVRMAINEPLRIAKLPPTLAELQAILDLPEPAVRVLPDGTTEPVSQLEASSTVIPAASM
jgi:hypothetical protein